MTRMEQTRSERDVLRDLQGEEYADDAALNELYDRGVHDPRSFREHQFRAVDRASNVIRREMIGGSNAVFTPVVAARFGR